MNDIKQANVPIEVLFGKAQISILALLYGNSEQALYLRQIERLTGAGIGPVQREVKRLADAGILLRSVQGNQVYYQANRNSPIYSDLKSLMAKTTVSKRVSDSRVERNIRVPQKKLEEFCRRHHISKLAFFGSVLREDFKPDSDVDVLVDFETGHVPGLAFFSMQGELSQLLERRIDLHTPADLSSRFRNTVVKEAEVRYD